MNFCLMSAGAGVLLTVLFGRSLAPLLAAIGVFVLFAFGAAAVLTSAALIWCAYLIGEVIHPHAPSTTDQPFHFIFATALGLIVIALVMNVAVGLPINGPRMYTAVFAGLVALRWRGSIRLAQHLRTLWGLCRTRLGVWSAVGSIAIGTIVCVQLVYAGFPEIQPDSLALHLVIVDTVKRTGQWHFAADFLDTAVLTVGADWLYAIAYVGAGEIGVKLMNYLLLLSAGALVYLLSRQFGRASAIIATLILLSSPIAFTEANGIYVDNFLTMCVTTALVVCALWSTMPARDRVLSAAVVLGGLPAAKLHGVVIAFVLLCLLLTKRIWHDVGAAGGRIAVAALAIFMLGAVPYLISFVVTGNPIFPFYNAFFKSPYFDIWNFVGSYPSDIAPSAIFSLTFATSKHFQGTDGTFGFQSIVFLWPAIVATLLHPRFLPVSALVILLVYSVVILSQTADARYFYPVMPALSLSIALFISQLQKLDSDVFAWAGITAAALVAVLNFVYFPGAVWLRPKFTLAALADLDARNEMILRAVPVRLLVEKFNETYGTRARLVFMGQPVGFPLQGMPIYVNWYMAKVFHEMVETKTNEDVARWLSLVGATHLIMPTQGEMIWNADVIRRYLAAEAAPIMVVGNQALYRIPENVMFTTVLAKPGAWDQWARGSSKLAPDGVGLSINDQLSFTTAALSSEQRAVKIAIKASCATNQGQVIFQASWTFGGDSQPLVQTNASPCANGIGKQMSATFDRPSRALSATLRVINSSDAVVRIDQASVSTTAITLPAATPLLERHWAASPAWLDIKLLIAVARNGMVGSQPALH
jgi:hypothetical protein